MSMRTDYLEENGTLVTAVSQDSHFLSCHGGALLRQDGTEPRHHTLSADAALFPLSEEAPPL